MTFFECPNVETSHHLSQAVKAFHFRFEKNKKAQETNKLSKTFFQQIVQNHISIFQMEKDVESLLSLTVNPPRSGHISNVLSRSFATSTSPTVSLLGRVTLRCLWMLDVNKFSINFKIANVEMKFIVICLL